MKHLNRSLPTNLKLLGQVACNNWRSLAQELLDSPTKQGEDVTWFYVTKYQDQKHFFDSTGHHELRPEGDCETLNNSQWLVITFLDSGWNNNTVLHPLILERFEKIVELLKSIPGLTSATVHCLGKGVDITTHNDGTDDRCYSTLVTISSPKQDLVLKVDNVDYVPNKTDTFSFNSFLPHSIKNDSDEDWIFFVLRIAKDQYAIN